jgi:hypothetical protein
MSSINTNTIVSRYLLKILFMRHMKVVGALVSPKGTTMNS